MIYILTGDIRTGKTTALLNWSKSRDDVDGVLCPDGDHGKRYFLKIKTQERFELEVENASEKTITIGPFHFLKSAFEEANSYLLEANKRKDFKYVVIDELGKLELKNEGLHDAAKTLIPDFTSNENKHIILVVRTALLETIVNHYQIKTYTLLTKEDLKAII
ncbi:nucleoside-triphosphatase [Winogradskyella sp.]|uniref:nucleoside-triphosphatase n=1 Tax=Winogradskyella sp. TaxID=1883156 RepID=UPI00351273AF